MKEEHWRKSFARNTASNYANVVVRIGSGLLLFRMLFQHLSHEQFGYYALLWSLFGYAILLDFGLGVTVQRTVARSSATDDLATLNRLVTTVVWSFAGIGLALLLVFSVACPLFLKGIHVAPENQPEFARAYLVFFLMLALNFPLGLFHEILRGVQRLDVSNWTNVAGSLVNLGLMYWALEAGWSFVAIIFISTATTMFPNLLAALAAYRHVPGLSLHPRNFCFREVRGVLSFSVVAYLITFTTLIMQRTDQAVISATIGVAFVALYQVGFKAAEMFGMFSKQLHEALSPAAARLDAQKDTEGLRDLLFGSWRLTILVTTPLYALCAAFLAPIIRILSGVDHVDSSTLLVGQVLLFSTWSTVAVDSCARRILIMCGWEKKLLRLSLVEAVINLILSVGLVYRYGIPGVAIGTLIPTVLIGWFGVMPLTAKFAGASLGEILRQVVQPVLAPVGASLAALGVVCFLAPLPADAHIFDCVWRGALVVAAALPFMAKTLKKFARRNPVPAPIPAPVPAVATLP